MSTEQATPVITEVKKPDLKKKIQSEEDAFLYSRRDFFIKAGWYFFWVILSSWALGLVRYLFPRVLFEPSNIFKAGLPGEYPVGEISTRWASEQRVWIGRTSEGFYALLARCTHLGCTPIWLSSEDKFKCPCHGSGFYRDGINYEGPAPRALDRVKISLAPDGQILIDKGVLFQFEKGDWNKPEAFLKMLP